MERGVEKRPTWAVSDLPLSMSLGIHRRDLFHPCIRAMALKFEPLESALSTTWKLQRWKDPDRQEVYHLPQQAENPLSIQELPPAASAESLHAAIEPRHDMGSVQVNGHLEEANSCTSVDDAEGSARDASELSLRISDDPPSRLDTAQYNSQPEDLSSFVPLGAIEKNTNVESYPAREVELLKRHSWIYTRNHHDNPNERIYVEPKLAHYNNTQRSIKTLRQAFKVLMSKIDCSPEAWDGRCDAHDPDSATPGSEDDESLWYIFNTLQDPDPQADIVKDDWSRKAMLYLFSDEDFSDFGLKTRLYPYQRRSAAMMVQREVQPARMLDPRLQACVNPTGLEYYYDKEDGWITLEKYMYDETVGGKLPFIRAFHCLHMGKKSS